MVVKIHVIVLWANEPCSQVGGQQCVGGTQGLLSPCSVQRLTPCSLQNKVCLVVPCSSLRVV